MQLSNLSLHDALPIFDVEVNQPVGRGRNEVLEIQRTVVVKPVLQCPQPPDEIDSHYRERQPEAERARPKRSEEHTSELQSPCNLVCRLLLAKKNRNTS